MGPMREKMVINALVKLCPTKMLYMSFEKVSVTTFEMLKCRKINSYTLTQFTLNILKLSK